MWTCLTLEKIRKSGNKKQLSEFSKENVAKAHQEKWEHF